MDNKHKILLIEDDEDQIRMYQFKFEKDGFIFVAARTGEEGIKLAEEQRPNLILLDLMLIDISGVEVLEKLKIARATKDIPVIILTNLAQKVMKERALKFGAADFMIKTQIDPAGLVERVKKLIGVKK